jgi:hypothetical protein
MHDRYIFVHIFIVCTMHHNAGLVFCTNMCAFCMCSWWALGLLGSPVWAEHILGEHSTTQTQYKQTHKTPTSTHTHTDTIQTHTQDKRPQTFCFCSIDGLQYMHGVADSDSHQKCVAIIVHKCTMAFLDAVMSAGSHSAFAFVLCVMCWLKHHGVALCWSGLQCSTASSDRVHSQRRRGQDMCKRLVDDDTEKQKTLLSCCVMFWQKHSGVALLVASTAV